MSDQADPLFLQAFQRLLAAHCTPEVVRQIERGTPGTALWQQLEASGFLDALVPEAAGGAGLSLAQALPLFEAEGSHAVPLPVAHTLFVRSVLATAGVAWPVGPISIASHTRHGADGSTDCTGTPYGLVAEWVAAAAPSGWLLLPAQQARRTATGIHSSLLADLHWPTRPAQALHLPQPADWPHAGALLTSALLAGTLQQVLQMTVAYANQREQFGRSIGKFQAVQHQLAVLAEHVAASHMAAALGCSGAGPGGSAGTHPWPLPLRAALAKARTSEAAALAAHTAHAVHGAIGITAEFNLQLYTRRLHEGRAAYGAETHWNRVLGRALLAETELSTLDFMRSALMPQQPCCDAAAQPPSPPLVSRR